MKILWDKMWLQRVLNERTEEEELEQMWEMSTIRKKDSGLPANIYVDDSRSYIRGRHAMRIKFQPDKADRPISSHFVSMTMDGDVMQNTLHHHTISLSSKEIDMIRNFVYNNVEALRALSDMKIEQDDFKDIMIPGGKAASPSEKERLHKDLAALLRSSK